MLPQELAPYLSHGRTHAETSFGVKMADDVVVLEDLLPISTQQGAYVAPAVWHEADVDFAQLEIASCVAQNCRFRLVIRAQQQVAWRAVRRQLGEKVVDQFRVMEVRLDRRPDAA